MTTWYFMGGEDHDFTKIGTCVVDTTTAARRRTDYARCALTCGPQGAGVWTDGWVATLSAPASSFWVTGRFYVEDNYNAAGEALVFRDGTQRRLYLKTGPGADYYHLYTRNAAGANVLLATSGSTISFGSIIKIDVFVNYAVAGQVQVYIDGTKIIDYSGDVTTNGATTLSSVVFGNWSGQATAGSSYGKTSWTEVIIASTDTRGYSLCTLGPTGVNGNAWGWSGSSADIDEISFDDTDSVTSTAAAQVAQAKVDSTGIAAVGSTGIAAVCVSGRAAKGSAAGPTKLDLGVRTGGVDYWGADISLSTSLDRVSTIWETNPNTATDWLESDLTSVNFNIGAKSIA